MARRIFDVHTHVWPDKVASSAVAYLQAKSHNLPVFSDGTAGGLRERALEAGYTGWLNCPVVTRPGQSRGVNEKAAKANVWPSLSLGGVHPEDADVVGELQRLVDLGLLGLKLHPEYQSFSPLEARMEPVWDWCESHRLPVLFHAGNDVGFEPPYHSCPADFAELRRRHPEMVIICAHMGGWLAWDEFERDLMGHDVLIDTSFSAPYMRDQPGRFERLIRGHGVGRVLYGTDSPWQALTTGVADIEALTLSDEDKDRILWGNAARVFGLEARLPATQP